MEKINDDNEMYPYDCPVCKQFICITKDRIKEELINGQNYFNCPMCEATIPIDYKHRNFLNE